MYGEKDFDSSEERLRKHIRDAFEQAGGSLPEAAMRTFEDTVLAFMKAYFDAPPESREGVYRQQEERLLETIGSLGRDYPSPQRSTNVRDN
jgi:hypothetical protein